MRRIGLLLLACVLALPAAALASRSAPGDGSLVVSGADGVLTVAVKGVIFGQFDRGKMTVLDYKADGNALPTVSGAKVDVKGAKVTVVYTGNDVRFLFPSGKYTLKFEATGIDLSAVGKGTLQVASKSSLEPLLSGKTSLDDGTVSVNGGKAIPLPSVAAFGGALAVTADKADKVTNDKVTNTVDKSASQTLSSSTSR